MSDYCPHCGRPNLPVICGRRALTGPFKTREELRDAVMNLLGEGKKVTEIAKLLGPSISTISRIKHGDRTQTVHGYRVPVRQWNGKN